jgi:hypothetical protein
MGDYYSERQKAALFFDKKINEIIQNPGTKTRLSGLVLEMTARFMVSEKFINDRLKKWLDSVPELQLQEGYILFEQEGRV